MISTDRRQATCFLTMLCPRDVSISVSITTTGVSHRIHGFVVVCVGGIILVDQDAAAVANINPSEINDNNGTVALT